VHQTCANVRGARMSCKGPAPVPLAPTAARPLLSLDPVSPPPLHPEFLHVKPGKGAAFVRSKLKNLLTGNNNERTFRAGEQLNLAAVERREGQFTYAEGETVSDPGWGGGPAQAAPVLAPPGRMGALQAAGAGRRQLGLLQRGRDAGFAAWRRRPVLTLRARVLANWALGQPVFWAARSGPFCISKGVISRSSGCAAQRRS
jgi:hypothetical protein